MTVRDVTLSHGSVRIVDAGSGPAVVLIHGLGGNWRNWEAVVPGLARHHRVVALDLPGFGHSEPYGGAVTVDRYVDTVVELLDRLAIDRATVVGNSLGGLLTIEAAAAHPDRVAATVLVCSGGIPLSSRRRRMVQAVRSVALRPAAQRMLTTSGRARRQLVRLIVHDPNTVADGLLDEVLDGLAAPGFVAAFAAGYSYDARVRAPQIACPTLVLWGCEDRLLPVAMSEELHRLIPGSQLIVWDGTGHCPMIEDPARFHDVVTAFLAQTVGGPPPDGPS